MSAWSSSNHSGEFICTSALSRQSSCTRIVISKVFLYPGMRRADSAWLIFKQMLEKSYYFPSCLPSVLHLKERSFISSLQSEGQVVMTFHSLSSNCQFHCNYRPVWRYWWINQSKLKSFLCCSLRDQIFIYLLLMASSWCFTIGAKIYLDSCSNWHHPPVLTLTNMERLRQPEYKDQRRWWSHFHCSGEISAHITCEHKHHRPSCHTMYIILQRIGIICLPSPMYSLGNTV